MLTEQTERGLKSLTSVAAVGHQGHEAGTLNGPGDGMLARGMATRLSPADNTFVAIGQLP